MSSDSATVYHVTESLPPYFGNDGDEPFRLDKEGCFIVYSNGRRVMRKNDHFSCMVVKWEATVMSWAVMRVKEVVCRPEREPFAFLVQMIVERYLKASEWDEARKVQMEQLRCEKA